MDGPAQRPPADAWIGEIARLYERRMLRYAFSLTHDLDRAWDAVQDTLVELTRAAGALDRSRPAPWLFAVCRAKAMEVRRRETRARHLAEEALDGQESAEPPPDAGLTSLEDAETLKRMLADLPESHQEVLRLRFQEGLRNVEIADVTGMTANHVGVLLHKAIARLRRLAAVAGPTAVTDGRKEPNPEGATHGPLPRSHAQGPQGTQSCSPEGATQDSQGRSPWKAAGVGMEP